MVTDKEFVIFLIYVKIAQENGKTGCYTGVQWIGEVRPVLKNE